MTNRLAMSVEKPGARQLWAMKPSFISAKQITWSPAPHDGRFTRNAWSREKGAGRGGAVRGTGTEHTAGQGFVLFCLLFMPQQQYFSYIIAVI